MPEDLHATINKEAKDIIESFGYISNQAHCAVEAKPPVEWHKGKAAEYILSHTFGNDWRQNVQVVFAGDDTTDENVNSQLLGSALTFRVTQDPNVETKATYKIPSTESVTKILQWIDRKFSKK
jgi:trehalose-phosphatase